MNWHNPRLIVPGLLFWAGCATTQAAGPADTTAPAAEVATDETPAADEATPSSSPGADAMAEAVSPSVGMGAVRFQCDPMDAEVVVDGVTRGVASDYAPPAFIELSPGAHRIELRKAGFATFRTEVYVSEEVLETIPVSLHPLPAENAAGPEENES